jgi:hypothetical protein
MALGLARAAKLMPVQRGRDKYLRVWENFRSVVARMLAVDVQDYAMKRGRSSKESEAT